VVDSKGKIDEENKDQWNKKGREGAVCCEAGVSAERPGRVKVGKRLKKGEKVGDRWKKKKPLQGPDLCGIVRNLQGGSRRSQSLDV
jgi:hypothetical protein